MKITDAGIVAVAIVLGVCGVAAYMQQPEYLWALAILVFL